MAILLFGIRAARLARQSLWLCMAVASSASAAPVRHAFLESALSPDGRWLAVVEGDTSPSGGAPQIRELILRTTDGKRETSVPLACGAVAECWPSALAWTSDSRALSFALREPGSHARSIYQVGTESGPPKRLLHFDGTISAMRYARNGALAMLATPGAVKEVGATEAGAPLTGELEAVTPIQGLAVLDAAHGTLRQISPEGLFVYEFDWMPDGTSLVGTAAPGDGDRNWWIAKLYAFGTDGGKPRVLYAPRDARQQLTNPQVLADGQSVAFIAGLMSDFGSSGGELYVVPAAGGKARNLTPRSTSTVTAIDWGCDGHLRAQVLAGERQQRRDFGDGASSKSVQLWETLASRSDLDRACNADVEVALQQSFTEAPELHIGRAGTWAALTHRNAALSVNYTSHSLRWKSDGHEIQGWLLMPPQHAGGAALMPLIVGIHGGPAAAFRPSFLASGAWRTLLDHGYAMLLANPRGSFGPGEDFTQGNVKDFGGGDLRDILAGVDAAIAQYPIDAKRLGVTGHSYGGFMTMWAVTQTTRFKAAVAGAGIANWQSYYGQNGISEWMPPYFGASVYADPAVYAKSSPINFIGRVRTPTLSYVGETDLECPPAQTIEFGRALQSMGVPASTVIYPGEGHGLRKPATVADIERRTLQWFDRYLQVQPSQTQ